MGELIKVGNVEIDMDKASFTGLIALHVKSGNIGNEDALVLQEWLCTFAKSLDSMFIITFTFFSLYCLFGMSTLFSRPKFGLLLSFPIKFSSQTIKIIDDVIKYV